jgi:hypothetical protein
LLIGIGRLATGVGSSILISSSTTVLPHRRAGDQHKTAYDGSNHRSDVLALAGNFHLVSVTCSPRFRSLLYRRRPQTQDAAAAAAAAAAGLRRHFSGRRPTDVVDPRETSSSTLRAGEQASKGRGEAGTALWQAAPRQSVHQPHKTTDSPGVRPPVFLHVHVVADATRWAEAEAAAAAAARGQSSAARRRSVHVPVYEGSLRSYVMP